MQNALHAGLWCWAAFDICAILFGIWIGELGLNMMLWLIAGTTFCGLVLLTCCGAVNRPPSRARFFRAKIPSVALCAVVGLWPVVIAYVLFCAWFG